MVTAITPQQFHESPGVEDWRVVFGGARACFATGTFAAGVALVDRIGELADAANHHPDVDLRYTNVIVLLTTHELDEGRLSDRDAALAAQISAAARGLGIAAEPGRVQTVQIAIDALDIPAVLPFWQAVLGYTRVGEADLVDPLGRGPSVWFQQSDEPRPQRGRIHVDVSVPADVHEARIRAALAAGGRIAIDRFAPEWWTLADIEGNEVDVAPWYDTFNGEPG